MRTRFNMAAVTLALLSPWWAVAQELPAASPQVPSQMGSAPVTTRLSLGELKDRLALNADQLPAWAAFEAQASQVLALHYRQPVVQAGVDRPMPNQWVQWLTQQENRLAALEAVVPAANALYKQLSVSQQGLANQHLLATMPGFLPPTACASTPREETRGSGQAQGRGGRSRSW